MTWELIAEGSRKSEEGLWTGKWPKKPSIPVPVGPAILITRLAAPRRLFPVLCLIRARDRASQNLPAFFYSDEP